MDLLWLILGFLLGWLLNWLSDFLPCRLAKTPRPANLRGRAAGLPWMIGAMTAVACYYFGLRGQWVSLVLYAFFLLIALIDGKHRLVLNVLVYPAIALTLVYHLVAGGQSWTAVGLGGGLALAAFVLAAWLRPGDLGGGDVKLAALIGLIFGFPGVLWPLLLGVGLGGLAAAYLLLRGYGRRYHIPYAPFLSLGVFIALLYTPL